MSATPLTEESYRSYMHTTIANIALLKSGRVSADPSIDDMLTRAEGLVIDLSARQREAHDRLRSLVQRVEDTQNKAFAQLQVDLAKEEERLSLLETAGQDLQRHIEIQTEEYNQASAQRKDLTSRFHNLSTKASKGLADAPWLQGASWAARTVSFPIARSGK